MPDLAYSARNRDARGAGTLGDVTRLPTRRLERKRDLLLRREVRRGLGRQDTEDLSRILLELDRRAATAAGR